MAWRIILVCLMSCLFTSTAHCKNNTEKYALRRVGVRMRDDQIGHVSTQPSLLDCAKVCADNSTCMALSYHTEDRRCYTTNVDLSFRSGPNGIKSEIGWITMSNAKYAVYNRGGPDGAYSIPWEDAESVCEQENTTIASSDDLVWAHKLGLHLCNCGWLSGGANALVLQHPDSCYGGVLQGYIACEIQIQSRVWCLF